MRENDWTGAPVDDDDDPAFLTADADLYEFDPDDEALADEYAALMENEQVLHFASIADGAKSLRDAAESLFVFADELVALADEGWELVDDVAHGFATAVRFGAEEDDV